MARTDESFEVRHDRPGLLSMGSRGPGTNSSQVSCACFLFGVSRLFFSSSLLSFSLSRWLENAVRSASVHRSRGAEKARSSRCGVLPSFRITKCKCRLSEFGVGVQNQIQNHCCMRCEVVEVGSVFSADLCTHACVVAGRRCSLTRPSSL